MSDLTVSQAAARLGISERTVQRRCKSGKLPARLVTDEDGAQWLINGATLPTGDDTTADKVTTHTNAPARSQSEHLTADNGATLTTPRDKVTTGDDTRLLDQLRTENEYLKSQIDAWRLQSEAANRTAAEYATALRKALDQMPKALPDASTLLAEKTGREDAAGRTQAASADVIPVARERAAQPGRKPQRLTPWQRIGARILGIR